MSYCMSNETDQAVPPPASAMPRPGMTSPEWETLVPLSRCGVRSTLEMAIREGYELVLVTAGSPADHPDLRNFDVLGEYDVRQFFRRGVRVHVDCRQKTSFSHHEVWDSFFGPELFHARAATWASIEADRGASLRPGGASAICIIKCKHGLHRSQAVARFIGDLAAWRGLATCVINSTVFSRQWCHEDFRALVKHPPHVP